MADTIFSLWRRRSGASHRCSLSWRVVDSVLVTTIATLIYLSAGELAIRAATHVPLLADHDFRRDRPGKAINRYIEYDSELGWSLKPFISNESFHTLQYGIRANRAQQTEVKPGGVLVVGSSFTEGSGVKDDETWPAVLEGITGLNVNNAGQGGHVVDQIILNAEKLMPIVRPDVLIVDLTSNSILGAKYSWYGWPKPYFTAEQGALVQHHLPVPHTPSLETRHWMFDLKTALSHFAFADRFMNAFFADAWLSSENQKFILANNDEVAVTCLLLRRLKKETDAAQVRLLVSMQHGAAVITDGLSPAGEIVMVRSCINQMGIQLIDEFESLKKLYGTHPDALKKLYLVEAGMLGHKSALGNVEVAQAVKAALALPPPERSQSKEALAQESDKRWKPVLDVADPLTLFRSSEIATIEAFDASDARRGAVVKAVGPTGEHYVAAGIPEGGGSMRLRVEARADASSGLKLQLIATADGSTHGAMADFDLQQITSVPWRVGRPAAISSGIEPIGHGWSTLWVGVTFPPGVGTASIFFQLASSEGAYGFSPGREAIGIRRIAIDRLIEE